MNEDFLHYLWKFQKFDTAEFVTVDKEILHIQNPGAHNHNSGPDFFNGQIALNSQVWAGNIEIHIKSSDWYAHLHHMDPAYDNVILHVVWEHDAEVFRKDNSVIPTLVLQKYTSSKISEAYSSLIAKNRKWINCENDFSTVDSFTIDNWLERLYLERLELKEIFIVKELKASKNHWDALLFRLLCKNFGLKVNGEAFFSIAKSIDFSILKKSSQELVLLESLLMGQAGLLEGEKEDGYFKILSDNYEYQKRKFHLDSATVISPKFFRLRPPNFPSIRLAQLASLYSHKQNIFSEILAASRMEEFYSIFEVDTSEYWDTHYNFGVASGKRKKRLTHSFIDLLVINTIIPLKFCYAREHGKDISEEVLKLASEISCEENMIIKKFNSLKKVAKNAYHSQALLQLKSQYCDKNKCLQCAIGNKIISGNIRL